MASSSIDAERTGTRALRGVARYFVRRAWRALASPELGDTAVHDARKDLKRSRTALRLLRPALGESIYRRENAVLRDAAHALNADRDAKVLVQTLQTLCRNYRALRGNADVAELQSMLAAAHANVRRRLREYPSKVARTRGALDQLCGRAAHWPVGRHDWSVLGPALKRIYASGRRTMPTARPRPSDRGLHEWRKQVKYLRYSLEILAPMRPKKLARLGRRTKQLADDLGEAHDLAMLARKARAFAKRDRTDLQPLFTVIDRRRERLALDALTRGEQLYRARPRDWERPLGRYWRRWRRR